MILMIIFLVWLKQKKLLMLFSRRKDSKTSSLLESFIQHWEKVSSFFFVDPTNNALKASPLSEREVKKRHSMQPLLSIEL